MKNINKQQEETHYIEQGKLYLNQKDINSAVKEFQKSIKLNPENSEAHFELGKAYYMQNKYVSAIKELEETKKLDSQNNDTYLFLTKIYKTTGEFDLALEEIKGVLNNPILCSEAKKELNDIYPEYIREISACNFRGEYKKALCKIEKIEDIIPEEEVFFRNKLLNEEEIAGKKIVLDSKPRNLIVTLTKKCNLNCEMCFQDRSDWELPRKTLNEVISFFPYLERIVWQGGEVFLLDYFRDIVEQACRYPNLRQVITTNGLLIDKDWADTLVNNNVDITFSIDSLTKEVYEKLRKGGKFDELIKNLEYFTEVRRKAVSDINTNLHVVVMKSNYRQLEDFVDFAKKYEFRYLALLPIGGEFDSPENIFYNKDQEALQYIREVLPAIKEKAMEYGLMLENRLPVKIDKDIAVVEDSRAIAPEPVKNKMLCHLPWIQVYLEHDGTIRPDCNCMPHEIIGHISENSLEEVWNNSRMQEYRKRILLNNYQGLCNPECVAGRVSEMYLNFF